MTSKVAICARQAAPQPSEHSPERGLEVENRAPSFTVQKTDNISYCPRTSHPYNNKTIEEIMAGQGGGCNQASGENFYCRSEWAGDGGANYLVAPDTEILEVKTQWQVGGESPQGCSDSSERLVRAARGSTTGGDDQTTRWGESTR